MDYNGLTTRSVNKSLAFRARVKAQRNIVQAYPAALDVLLRIHHALLVVDNNHYAVPPMFAIELPPDYDVDKNSEALATFGWAVRSDGLVQTVPVG